MKRPQLPHSKMLTPTDSGKSFLSQVPLPITSPGSWQSGLPTGNREVEQWEVGMDMGVGGWKQSAVLSLSPEDLKKTGIVRDQQLPDPSWYPKSTYSAGAWECGDQCSLDLQLHSASWKNHNLLTLYHHGVLSKCSTLSVAQS